MTITTPATAATTFKRERSELGWAPILSAIMMAGLLTSRVSAQTIFTWQQIKEKFEAKNPTLQAAQIAVDESRAQEITAYLRPNPSLNMTQDGTQITRVEGEAYFADVTGDGKADDYTVTKDN